MAQAARLNLRMQKELKLLLTDPPPGSSFPFLSADSDLSSLSTIHAQIEGPEGTVYAKGVFEVKIQIPERYPFQPPSVTFVTPIYHPNIDSGGRICLDILNLPPKGAWQPSLNISTVLTSIGLLLSEPNPDDGLMHEASQEYKYNRQAFDQKARCMTQKYAKVGSGENSCSTQGAQTLKSSLSELGKLQESRLEVDEIVSSHKKPCGISTKLSLQSSSSNKNRNNDMELNEMEAKGKRKEVNITLDEGNLRHEKLCGSRRKLFLEYSCQIEKKIGHEKENGVANQSSHCKPPTISMVPSGSTVPQHDICSQKKHNHYEMGESINGSISKSSEQPRQFNQKKGSLDTFLVTDGNSEKMLIDSQELPSQSHSKASQGVSSMALPINGIELELHKDFINRLGKGSAETICGRICRAGRKLSLGSKGSSQGQEKDNKGNVVFVDKLLPVSCPKNSPRKSGIRRKLSCGTLRQLRGSNGSNSQLLSHSESENLAIDVPTSLPLRQDEGCGHKQSNVDDHDTKVSEENERQKLEGSTLSEAVIILDSEDSEEERDGALRSKLLLARKRSGKWRAKS